MCCFSKAVESVTDTQIFGRIGPKGNQVLIYQMNYKAAEDLSMVLPIPVKPGSGEKAVTFFDFSGYHSIFTDLHALFPVPKYVADPAGPFGAPPAAAPRTLEVHAVGAYDASYVPGIADFGRLDERFRLPDHVWGKLPGYRDYGFAVFKLKAAHRSAHPMAFAFPSALPGSVFFPTLHIHDGQIHDEEDFDHTLYVQGDSLDLNRGGWQESPGLPVSKVRCGLTHGMIRPEQHVFRNILRGRLKNGDIILDPKKA
jgi:hypothetical protein